MQKIVLVLVCCSLLSACGGRRIHPVEATTSYDSNLSCDHLKAELKINERHVDDLKDEKSHSENNNLGMLVTAPLFLDVSSAERDEITALERRNAVLKDLIARKCVN